jgi:hypothetical protein
LVLFIAFILSMVGITNPVTSGEPKGGIPPM